MRGNLLAAATALSLLTPAQANDLTDATAQCTMVLKAGVSLPATTPPDQASKIESALSSMCGCITSTLTTLGDDGAKALRVLARTTTENAMVAAADPSKDREISIAVVKAEFGLSDVDAAAWYDRMDPQIKQISETCGQTAAKSMQP